MSDDPLPPGWHTFEEQPAPGKSRLYLFEIPREGRKVGEAPSMTTVQFNPDAPGGYEAVTLRPIAWRYR